LSLAIETISHTTEADSYRVLLRVEGRPHQFVVEMSEEPIVGLSAPHAFWVLCRACEGLAETLGSLLHRYHLGQEIDLPVVVQSQRLANAGLAEASTRSPGHRLSTESLTWAHRYLHRYGDTNLFPKAFEYDVVHRAWDSLLPIARAIDLQRHSIDGYRQIRAPKAAAGTRLATQLDPLDAVLLTASAYELGHVTERSRVPVSDGVVHSFRFDGSADGDLWRSDVTYETFQERTRELIQRSSVQFVAETDISSFYHRVTADVVERALEKAGADLRRTGAVGSMLRTFGDRGLPVGPAASAFFAELVLNDIDAALLASGLTFVRFNDDYRFFCGTEGEARMAIQLLSDLLWQGCGLTIQTAKTRVSGVGDYETRLPDPHDWLRNLRRGALLSNPYGPVEEPNRSPKEQKLLNSARSVLHQALESNHVMWLRLGREALGALPLHERTGEIPGLLDDYERTWPLARDISRTIAWAARSNSLNYERTLSQIAENIDSDRKLQNIPDYGWTWLMNALVQKDWPSIDQLPHHSSRFAREMAVQRELVLALRNDASRARKVRINPADPWHRRAMLLATGDEGVHSDRSETTAWDRELNAALSEFER
jgi:hypothetical protein